MGLRDEVLQVAPQGVAAVAQKLLAAGNGFDRNVSADIQAKFRTRPRVNLFLRSVVLACEWAGFVSDPSWFADGCDYMESLAPRLSKKYARGFHGNSDPIANLTTWRKVIDDPNVPNPPGATASVADLVRFSDDAFASLKSVEWRKERRYLASWTFYGSFKIYLLHQQHLWSDPLIDHLRMPTGGLSGRYSFENGWEALRQLGLVQQIPKGEGFDEGLRRTEQVHTEVLRLANAVNGRALHINSGIYLLGGD